MAAARQLADARVRQATTAAEREEATLGVRISSGGYANDEGGEAAEAGEEFVEGALIQQRRFEARVRPRTQARINAHRRHVAQKAEADARKAERIRATADHANSGRRALAKAQRARDAKAAARKERRVAMEAHMGRRLATFRRPVPAPLSAQVLVEVPASLMELGKPEGAADGLRAAYLDFQMRGAIEAQARRTQRSKKRNVSWKTKGGW